MRAPRLTGRTRHGLNEPASDPARTQWTDPCDKRPNPGVPDPDAPEPELGDVRAPTGVTSTSEPHHEGDPGVDPRKANPHELMRRERGAGG